MAGGQLSYLGQDEKVTSEFRDPSLEEIIAAIRKKRQEGRKSRGFTQQFFVKQFFSYRGINALVDIYHGSFNMEVNDEVTEKTNLPYGMLYFLTPAEYVILMYSVGRIKEDEDLFQKFSAHSYTDKFPQFVERLFNYGLTETENNDIMYLFFQKPTEYELKEYPTLSAQPLRTRLEEFQSLRPNSAEQFEKAFNRNYIPSDVEIQDNLDNRKPHWHPERYYVDVTDRGDLFLTFVRRHVADQIIKQTQNDIKLLKY